jgi:hypothetical protein
MYVENGLYLDRECVIEKDFWGRQYEKDKQGRKKV